MAFRLKPEQYLTQWDAGDFGDDAVEMSIDNDNSRPDELHLIVPYQDYRRANLEFRAAMPDGTYCKLIIRVTGHYSWSYHARNHRRHGLSKFQQNIFWMKTSGELVLPAIEVATHNICHGHFQWNHINGYAGAYKDKLDKLGEGRPYFTTTIYNSQHDHGPCG